MPALSKHARERYGAVKDEDKGGVGYELVMRALAWLVPMSNERESLETRAMVARIELQKLKKLMDDY